MTKIVVAMLADFPIDSKKLDGGVQAVTYYLARELRSDNEIEVVVVTFNDKIVNEKLIYVDDFRVYMLPRYRFGAITGYRHELHDVKKCLAKISPDIVHGQDAGIEGYLAIRSGYPSVITLHGIIGQDAKFISNAVEKYRCKLRSIVSERFCVNNAKNTILISPYVKKYYGRRLKGEVRYIANPVRPEYFNLKKNERRKRILFAGKIIPRKGVLDLIHAVAIVNKKMDVEVVLAGAVDDQSYYQDVIRLVNDYGLTDNVHYLGLLNEKEMLKEFSSASILVLPSYQETAPMVIQQAMAAGLPVIATEICGVPNQLKKDEEGFLFKPGDCPMLAKYLLTLLENKSIKKAISKSAKSRADKNYRSEIVAAETVSYYKDIISENSI